MTNQTTKPRKAVSLPMALVPDNEYMARETGIWIANHPEPELADLACGETCHAEPFAPTQQGVDPADTLSRDNHRHIELVKIAAGRPTSAGHLIIVRHLVRRDTAPELRVIRYPLVV
jgi:hypothetical protein